MNWTINNINLVVVQIFLIIIPTRIIFVTSWSSFLNSTLVLTLKFSIVLLWNLINKNKNYYQNNTNHNTYRYLLSLLYIGQDIITR